MEINLDYANSRMLLLPAADTVHLALVGCGGTGSWLAPAVARIGRLLGERFSKQVTITFIDPDQVEEKNVYRQNFCQAEIGRNKAETLAYRFGLAWGLEIHALAEAFSNKRGWREHNLLVLIGCVDNAPARRDIWKTVKAVRDRVWWLDCGNERNSGQVLLGCGAKLAENIASLPGRCAWLPAPAVQHPDLLEGMPNVEIGPGGMSCADIALADSQGLAINQRMAAEAADYLVRMLITRDLRKYATYIDLESGVCRSKYITDAAIKEWRVGDMQ